MAVVLKHSLTSLPLILGMLLNLTIYLSVADTIATTAVAPMGVKRCYKCEGDCNGGLGIVEECHPDSDSLIFACYTILVEGKAFQRGCTLDFSEGENCVKERGNTYCFCRTDECNNSLGFSLAQTCSKATVLLSIILGVICGKIMVS